MTQTEFETLPKDSGSPVVVMAAGTLESIIRKIFIAVGAEEQNAVRVAEALVASDVCGVDTHGAWHVPGYVEAIRRGEIDPIAKPSVLCETANTSLVSGGWTFGHVGAKFATEIAIEKAHKQNLSLVSLVRAHHIGRLGEYVELAASQGLISMIWAGGFSENVPAAVPFGGRTRVLHTNPIAMAFPLDRRPSMMFDFATTVGSGVKLHEARSKQQQLPPGFIVDRDGNPTTDPVAFFEGGAHLPFGNHKGYALMLAAEYLGRILTDSDAFTEAPRGGAIFGHSGTTIIAFKPDLFQPFDNYRRHAQELETRIRAVPPAPGFKEVLMPGDLEHRTRSVRLRDGIPISQRIWQNLTELALSLGITDF
jgi:hydroxycarboxylate dehydrogenase B